MKETVCIEVKSTKEVEFELPCYRKRENFVARIQKNAKGDTYSTHAYTGSDFPTLVGQNEYFWKEYFDDKSQEATEQEWVDAVQKCMNNIEIILHDHVYSKMEEIAFKEGRFNKQS